MQKTFDALAKFDKSNEPDTNEKLVTETNSNSGVDMSAIVNRLNALQQVVDQVQRELETMKQPKAEITEQKTGEQETEEQIPLESAEANNEKENV